MSINQLVKDYIVKPFMALVLVYGISGCELKEGVPRQIKSEQTETPKGEKTYFDKFGYIADANNMIENRFGCDITQLKPADLDGDGDLDIIVGTESGRIITYENRMPQKE
ncbi:hypothetical protein KY342_03875 [Candidatus Woesearchaeota archaeon]|nr:hypothetical protein [Candidatus Woesearchaeota archaeon]